MTLHYITLRHDDVLPSRASLKHLDRFEKLQISNERCSPIRPYPEGILEMQRRQTASEAHAPLLLTGVLPRICEPRIRFDLPSILYESNPEFVLMQVAVMWFAKEGKFFEVG
jgi:hypothetical protein